MKIIQGTTQFHIDGKTAVALGKFDGIHRGHRILLDKIIAKKKEGFKAVVFTFDVSPLSFFTGKMIPGLTTIEEKRRIFEYLGVDVLVELPLNKDTAATAPEAVIKEWLYEGLNMRYIVAGQDISFGDKGKGDVNLLLSMANSLGYEAQIVDKLYIEGFEVSSTVIRNLVTEGKMQMVEKLIGVPYCVIGEVVHGKQLGRTIGMPTVNQLPDANKLLPPNGVYYSTVSVDGKHYRSITNIGCKPTVSDDHQMGVETYLYDFNGDLYGKDVRVKLLEFKRPEMVFDGIESLKKQMEADIRAGESYTHGLSMRLSALVNLTPKCDTVYDVGCDHGFTSINLFQRGICNKAYAMDVRSGPLKRASEHIEEKKLGDNITTILSDGLKEITAVDDNSCVLISGMGGNLMCDIIKEAIENHRLKEDTRLILQPQSELEAFRRFLRENGMKIVDEDMVREDGKFYPMMLVAFADGYKEPVNSETDHIDTVNIQDGCIREKRGPFGQKLIDRYGPILLSRRNRILLGYLEFRMNLLEDIETSLTKDNIADTSCVSQKSKDRLNEILVEKKEISEIIDYFKKSK